MESRRADDNGWACWIALRASEAWDWIDKRDIDKHLVSLAILYGTIEVVRWAMDFATLHSEKSGTEAAIIIAAVSAPYMALQAAAIAFYFRARQ